MKRLLLLLLIVLTLAIPVPAEVYRIDPANPIVPDHIKLSASELARLQTLQSAVYPYLQSDVSPDNRTVTLYDGIHGLTFLDTRNGSQSPISEDLLYMYWLTETRWLNATKLVLVGSPDGNELWFVTVDRATGVVSTQPLEAPGYPISLSPGGQKLLLVRLASSLMAQQKAGAMAPGPPIRTVPLSPRYLKAKSAALFEAEDKLVVRVATGEIELVVYDLTTKKEKVLASMASDTALAGLAWAPNEQAISLIRWQWPNNSRGGSVPDDDPGVLDALGRLAAPENPFFTSNVLDIFDISGKAVRQVEVRPEVGEVFLWAFWSPDSKTLGTQVWRPSSIAGRKHPTYANGDRSTYRFYSSEGRAFQTLSEPEVSSIYSVGPFFVSPVEVLIGSPWGMGWGFYTYNLSTRRLGRLAVPEGAIYSAVVTRGSREAVFSFGSFENPPEIYRIGFQGAPTQVTHLNDAIRSLNQIRVDIVAFTVAGGGVREGRLIQPQEGEFPPENVPIILWQQGGPTGYMGNEWGGSVEAPFALLPNFGFAVLVVPLEGRVNLGPELLNALADNANFGQIDVDEGAEIAKQMVQRGWTKSDRLGVTGCSYGGYFTSQSITQHPDIYAAANTQCTLLNLFDEYQHGYKPYISYLMGRTPYEDPDEVTRDSPLLNASKVKTPTLIFDGVRDFLPWQFSQQLHDDINSTGTEADFFLFEREGHGLGWPNSQLVAGQAQIEWFRRFLKRD